MTKTAKPIKNSKKLSSVKPLSVQVKSRPIKALRTTKVEGFRTLRVS